MGSLSNAVNHYSWRLEPRKGCTSTEIPGGGQELVQRQKEMVLWLCAVFVSSRVGYLPHDCGNFGRPLYK